MKRCPNCATDYYDEMLEFCIEDGAKLVNVSKISGDNTTHTKPIQNSVLTEKTLNLPFAAEISTVESIKSFDKRTILKNNPSIKKLSSAGSKVLEVIPIFFALAHNWWQWLYTVNQTNLPISNFLVSGSFILWLLLLVSGAGISLIAVRRSQNKGFANTSLVILAINLILFLVPKH